MSRKAHLCIVFILIGLLFLGAYWVFDKEQKAVEKREKEIKSVIGGSHWSKEDEALLSFTEKVLRDNGEESINELAEFIPIEHLRHKDGEQFYHFGETYGYFIKHRTQNVQLIGKTQTLLLSDILIFDITISKGWAAVTTTVKPMFSETFSYTREGENEAWKKIIAEMPFGKDVRAKIYMTGNEFSTFILNSKSSNPGDADYDNVSANSMKLGSIKPSYHNAKKINDINGKTAVPSAFKYSIGKSINFIENYNVNDIKDFNERVKEVFLPETVVENEEATAYYWFNLDIENERWVKSINFSTADELVIKADGGYVDFYSSLSGFRVNGPFYETSMYNNFSFNLLWVSNAGEKSYLNEKDERGDLIPFCYLKEEKFLSEQSDLDGEGEINLDLDEEKKVYNYNLKPNKTQKFKLWPQIRSKWKISSEIPFTIYYYEGNLIAEKVTSWVAESKSGEYFTIVVESVDSPVQATLTAEYLYEVLSFGQHVLKFDDRDRFYYRLDNTSEYFSIKTPQECFINILDDRFNYTIIVKGQLRIIPSEKNRYVRISVITENIGKTYNITCQKEKDIVYYSENKEIKKETIINDNTASLFEPEMEGFKFDGWYFNEHFLGEKATVQSIKDKESAEIKLYAKWVNTSNSYYSLNYVLPQTVEEEPIEMEYVELVNLINFYSAETDNYDFPTIKSVKYELEGWYFDEQLTQKCEVIPKNTTGDKTLYANLVYRFYTVKFNTGMAGFCDPIKAKYKESITLPNLNDRIGYIGTWGEWGEKLENGKYPTTFGAKYVVEQDITLKASWKIVWQITYKNVTFKGETATIKQDNGDDALSYYVEGDGVDLTKITAKFENYPNLVFLGWDDKPTFEYSEEQCIEKTETGEKILYAQWRYDFKYEHQKYDEIKVTEKSHLKQKCSVVDITGLPVEDLKELGINAIALTTSIKMENAEDGNQEIYFYADKNGKKLLASKTDIEYGSQKGLIYSGAYKFTVWIYLDDLNDCSQIFIRYGSSGKWKSSWKHSELFIEVVGVVEKYDISKAYPRWEEQYPF